MADGLLEAVRGLRLADPELGPKPLLAKFGEAMAEQSWVATTPDEIATCER